MPFLSGNYLLSITVSTSLLSGNYSHRLGVPYFFPVWELPSLYHSAYFLLSGNNPHHLGVSYFFSCLGITLTASLCTTSFLSGNYPYRLDVFYFFPVWELLPLLICVLLSYCLGIALSLLRCDILFFSFMGITSSSSLCPSSLLSKNYTL